MSFVLLFVVWIRRIFVVIIFVVFFFFFFGCFSPSLGKAQSSLLSLWGTPKSKSTGSIVTAPSPKTPIKMEDEEEAEKTSTLSAKFIAVNGFAIVLSHAVCALFDRVEMLYFLGDSSTVQTVIAAKRDKLSYPSFVPNRHGIPFQTREQMMEYMGTSHLLHVFLQASGQLPDASNVWSAVSSDDVPVPGRPLRPSNLTRDFCKNLLLKTCLTMHREGCFDLERDALHGVAGFSDLSSLLAQHDKHLKETNNAQELNDWVEMLSANDAQPLSVFEPATFGVAEASAASVSAAPTSLSFSPPSSCSSSQPSQALSPAQSQVQMMYMRRFRREYVLLYILRFGVDFMEKQKDYECAVLVLRLLLSLAPHVRPHAQRKMGHFWLRLSMDCVHLTKSKVAAHAVCCASLEQGPEELSLSGTIKMQQRALMLAKAMKHDALPEFPLLRQLTEIVHGAHRGLAAATRNGPQVAVRRARRPAVLGGRVGAAALCSDRALERHSHRGKRLAESFRVASLWDFVYDSSMPFVFSAAVSDCATRLVFAVFLPQSRSRADDLFPVIAGRLHVCGGRCEACLRAELQLRVSGELVLHAGNVGANCRSFPESNGACGHVVVCSARLSSFWQRNARFVFVEKPRLASIVALRS